MKLFSVFLALITITLVFSNCKNETIFVEPTVIETPKIYAAPFTLADPSAARLLKLDETGKIVWEKQPAAQASNFQKWTIGGKTRYTYFEADPTNPRIPDVGHLQGFFVVLDEEYKEINRFSLLPNYGRTEKYPLDIHEFILIDDNHYIGLAYHKATVNNIPAHLNPVADCEVADCIIQEVKDNKVIWEWHSIEFPEFYETSVEGANFGDPTQTDDYLHMNSMFIDPRDNNLICSSRHTNQVIKIKRGTNEIVWRLGGQNSDFQMGYDPKFLRQHHATLVDNNQTLLVFDNGNQFERPYSRVLEFSLDETRKRVNATKVYNLPDAMFAQYMGSVQKIGDTYLIGCGSLPRVLEINYKTGVVNLDATLSNSSYRAYKY